LARLKGEKSLQFSLTDTRNAEKKIGQLQEIMALVEDTMRVMLGSGGFRTPERIRFLTGQMRDLFGTVESLLFVPYALQDHDGYVRDMCERGINAGYALDGIHRAADPHRAVEQAEAIFVGGGNTFRLLKTLYQLNLLDVLRECVRGGLPYLGISAGCNVACPTLMTTNDMPIVQPPSFAALGLVPFQVNPHYFVGRNYVKVGVACEPHFGETRDERIREFHEMNGTAVVGLWEGGILRVVDGDVSLHGARARVFRRGQEPVDVAPGTELNRLLGIEP
jgi:dipeptidase E